MNQPRDITLEERAILRNFVFASHGKPTNEIPWIEEDSHLEGKYIEDNGVFPFDDMSEMTKEFPRTGWFKPLPPKTGSYRANTEPDSDSENIAEDPLEIENEDIENATGRWARHDAFENYIDYEPFYKFPDHKAVLHFAKVQPLIDESFRSSSRFLVSDLHPKRMADAFVRDGKQWSGLHDYQKDGVGLMRAQEIGERGPGGGGMLCDEMGLGKTVQIIALLSEYPLPGSILVVLPASLIPNWTEELDRFAEPKWKVVCYDGTQSVDDLKAAEIVIVTYSRLRSEWSRLAGFNRDMAYRREHPYPFPPSYPRKKMNIPPRYLDFERPHCPLFLLIWSRIFFDECQIAKNTKKPTAHACLHLLGKNKWLVTGTPLTNEYSELLTYAKILKIAPYDQADWYKCHFLLRGKNAGTRAHAKATAGDKRFLVRKTDIQVLGPLRDAILHATLHGSIIRRKRDSIFNNVSLSASIPQLHREKIILTLDNGELYPNIKYAMRDVPKGYNSPTDVKTVNEFFAWVKQGGKGSFASGERFKSDVENFQPISEQHVFFESRLQWSQKLRIAIGQAEEAKAGDGMPKQGRLLLSKITTARLAGFHYAIPGVGYGIEIPEISIGDEEDGPKQVGHDDLTISQKGARNKFRAWLRLDSNWKTTKVEACVAKIREILRTKPEDKMIICCYSVAVLDTCEVALSHYDIQVSRFDGTMSLPDRNKARYAFSTTEQHGPKVLLLSSMAGGVGLNLVGANHILFPIPDWSPANEDQNIGRAWREGQTKECYSYHFIAEFSMDVRVDERQSTKRSKAYSLIDLYNVDPDSLAENDANRCKETKKQLEKMKHWDEQEFLNHLAKVEVEERQPGAKASIEVIELSSDDE